MPFNSNSYHRNKAKRQAGEYLAAARRIKALNPGRAIDDITRAVRLARLCWRSYMSYKRMGECNADLKRRLCGDMSHAEFMAKWKD